MVSDPKNDDSKENSEILHDQKTKIDFCVKHNKSNIDKIHIHIFMKIPPKQCKQLIKIINERSLKKYGVIMCDNVSLLRLDLFNKFNMKNNGCGVYIPNTYYVNFDKYVYLNICFILHL